MNFCSFMFMGAYVYILASRRNGTLYTGVTNDLERRVWEHREGITGGFTKNYGVKRLVWYREYQDIVMQSPMRSGSNAGGASGSWN